jgi:hypothetical protein
MAARSRIFPQLSDITIPTPAHQVHHRLVAYTGDFETVLAIDVMDERLGEHGDVVQPFT